jgi:hypothetical protein
VGVKQKLTVKELRELAGDRRIENVFLIDFGDRLICDCNCQSFIYFFFIDVSLIMAMKSVVMITFCTAGFFLSSMFKTNS